MDDRPRYMISVAAEIVGMHPQTGPPRTEEDS